MQGRKGASSSLSCSSGWAGRGVQAKKVQVGVVHLHLYDSCAKDERHQLRCVRRTLQKQEIVECSVVPL